MNVWLLFGDRDFDYDQPLPKSAQDVAADLELATVWEAMSGGDKLVPEVSRRVLLQPLSDPEEILYRQAILIDCIAHPDVIRELYELAGEALRAPRGIWGWLSSSPKNILDQSLRKLEVLEGFLAALREAAERHISKFSSAGLRRLCRMLIEELDAAYLARVEEHLRELRFKGGMLISAGLTDGNRGAEYTLRRARDRSWLERVRDRSGYSFTVPERDEAGMRALSALEDRATNLAANAVAQSVDHVLGFLAALRTELAFYVGCLNLRERLATQGAETALPVPQPGFELGLSGTALYDVSLALTLQTGVVVVANDLAADEQRLVMITGANQGGKSTFMRALGLAQLMMQAGMFVGAASFTASVATGVFTHYKREEDATLRSGKLDEELARMSEIVDSIASGGLLLCNESFAATNEREGSEVARQVIRALVDSGVRVVFVTHLFELADGLHREGTCSTLFLRAERGGDGDRPFKLVQAPPLPTSYGEDSYRKVFGDDLTEPRASSRGGSGG